MVFIVTPTLNNVTPGVCIISFCNFLLLLLILDRGRRQAAVESAAVTKSELSTSAGKDDDEEEEEEVYCGTLVDISMANWYMLLH